MWNWFTDVFNPQGVGFGPYRTEFREIEAYARMTEQIIYPREVMLIRILCERYMIIGDKKAKSGVPEGTKNLTDMKDSKGLKALFSRMGNTPKSKRKSKAPPG